MTVVPTRPSRSKAAWLSRFLASTSPHGERLYVAVALGLSLLLVVTYGVGRWLEGAQQEQNRALVAGGRDVGAGQPVGSGGSGAQSADLSAQDSAPATLPTWVQTSRGTKMWSAPSGGSFVGSLGQWQYLKVLAADVQRLDVQTTTGNAEGWIEVGDVAIAGPPPDWVVATRDCTLFSAADSFDSVGTVLPGTSMEVAGDSSSDRLFVYMPTDVSSRKTGYGWIQADSVAPTTAPAGVALPSPQYRAVPKGRAGTYRVRAGDTVNALTARFSISKDELFRLSGLDPNAKIMVGQVLQVPSPGESTAQLAQTAGPKKIRDISPGWVSSEHAVVIDGDSGEILWARDPNTPVAPASLTKIVTALVTLDHANLQDSVSVHVDSRRLTDSTVMGIYPGEELTVEDLLYGLMLPSGNDAALALAEYVSGTREAFADLMNEKVKSLGLTGSHFANPHGLDADGHVS